MESGLTIGIINIFLFFYYIWNIKTILNKQLDRDKSLLPASRYLFMTSFSLFPSYPSNGTIFLSSFYL